MKQIKAFLLGIFEFRLDCTTHFDDPLIEWYDYGRDFAHKLTLRKFES